MEKKKAEEMAAQRGALRARGQLQRGVRTKEDRKEFSI